MTQAGQFGVLLAAMVVPLAGPEQQLVSPERLAVARALLLIEALVAGSAVPQVLARVQLPLAELTVVVPRVVSAEPRKRLTETKAVMSARPLPSACLTRKRLTPEFD